MVPVYISEHGNDETRGTEMDSTVIAFIFVCAAFFTVELLSITAANEIACRIMRRKGWNVGDYMP